MVEEVDKLVLSDEADQSPKGTGPGELDKASMETPWGLKEPTLDSEMTLVGDIITEQIAGVA